MIRLLATILLAGAITPGPTIPVAEKYKRPYVENQFFDADGTPIPDTQAQGVQCGQSLKCSLVELESEGETKLRLRIDVLTPTPTAGANDCCNGFVGFNVCGPAVTTHCTSGVARTPVYGAVCNGGSGRCHTMTPTVAPTATPTP